MIARRYVLAGVSTIALTAASVMALAVTGASSPYPTPGGRAGANATCAVPTSLPGPRVRVTLADMGAMMGGAIMRGWIAPAQHSVPAGRVTLVAVNQGHQLHELLVLPLQPGASVGQLAVRSDGTVNEDGSLGEASNNCSPGDGAGIRPGDAGWVTVTLTPGRYELLCNRPGHYPAGMYAELDVRTG